MAGLHPWPACTPDRPAPLTGPPDPRSPIRPRRGPRITGAAEARALTASSQEVSETCTDIGGYAYSLHQAPGGGYVLAGDSDMEFTSEVVIVPWQAAVGASGSLRWQHFYYQTYTTGLPLTENFQASALAPGGGYLSTGPTENYTAQREEMYVVETDGSGLAGACGDVHPVTKLRAISPQLTAVAPALPVQAAVAPAVASPIGTTPTTITTQTDC